MHKNLQKIVVLATGGTIAGTASSAADHTGYTAAQIGVAQLLSGISGLHDALQGHPVEAEQVAQIDSKDMDFATMGRLAQRCSHFLVQSDVAGVVITHGTDTLEETAWFLQLALPAELLATKSVVLTCAMRPATSSESDGPRNVCDAVRVALDSAARGVLSVCAGDVHSAEHVQKVHTHALNAFSSGDAGPMARLQGAKVLWQTPQANIHQKNSPQAQWNVAQAATNFIVSNQPWPRVEIVHNYVGASGAVVRALLRSALAGNPALRGIVVAGTGNGTLANDLQAALIEAQNQGVQILRASRCAWGGVSATANDVLPCTALSAVKARVGLTLQLALR
jgi:L-asparaginase